MAKIAFNPGGEIPQTIRNLETDVGRELALENHSNKDQASEALGLLENLVAGIFRRELSSVAWLYFAMILAKHCEAQYTKTPEKRVLEGLQIVRSLLAEDTEAPTSKERSNLNAGESLSKIVSNEKLPLAELNLLSQRQDDWDTQYFIKMVSDSSGSFLEITPLVEQLRYPRAFVEHVGLLPRQTKEDRAVFSYYLLAAAGILIEFLAGRVLDFQLEELFDFVWTELLATLAGVYQREQHALLIVALSKAAAPMLLENGVDRIASRALMTCPRDFLAD